MTNTDSSRKIHHGRNIKRFREMFGLKQEALALELGDDWSQKKVSRMEENERVEDEVLEQVAKILKVPVEAIKNFDEEAAINIISNTFHESAFINSAGTFNINPVEKWIQTLEENKKLYEQLIKEKEERIALLQKLFEAMK